ncbi:hypothetical protein [Neisseria lactamica]|uniref:hypothetical protein n=1 Tax=Neisseria lactamica TaxID=486 RepID=UPI00117E5859|nr:hypothetical protein [Neisseria lactamica]
MSCTTWASVAQADNPFNYQSSFGGTEKYRCFFLKNYGVVSQSRNPADAYRKTDLSCGEPDKIPPMFYSGLTLNHDKAAKPQTVQIQGNAVPV